MTHPARGLVWIPALAFVSLLAGGAALAHGSRHAHAAPRTLLSFHTMYGVDGPFVGEANPVAGVPGDELPWEIGAALGRLDTEGRLFLLIHGLVFKDEPEVPPELRGINDEEAFRALVSCLTEAGDSVERRNVVTQGFPATRSGDSLIVTRVELPNPCIAPTVLVLAGSEDKWFAVTGFENEEGEQ